VVTVHELAESPLEQALPNLELLQDGKNTERPATVRCPSCGGLRSIAYRNRDTTAYCPACRKGKVVPFSRYHNYWTKRFTMDEIREMAHDIWG